MEYRTVFSRFTNFSKIASAVSRVAIWNITAQTAPTTMENIAGLFKFCPITFEMMAMVIQVVEFSSVGYKIRKIFA